MLDEQCPDILFIARMKQLRLRVTAVKDPCSGSVSVFGAEGTSSGHTVGEPETGGTGEGMDLFKRRIPDRKGTELKLNSSPRSNADRRR